MSTGSRSVWLNSKDGTNKLALGGRYTGERLYGEATIGRVRMRGGSFQTFNRDGTVSTSTWESHLLEGAARFGLILMPTSPWSVCVGASGLYGASNSVDVETFVFSGGFFLGSQRITVDGDASSWNTALEASVGFVSGERSMWAPWAGISFEYGGQTFGDGGQTYGEWSDTYTGFEFEIGTGVRYGRVLGLITYFRVVTHEFSNSDPPPGQGCFYCSDGLRLGLGVVF